MPVAAPAWSSAAELLQEGGRVDPVGRRIVCAVAGIDAGKLPVDVDAVEDSGPRTDPAGLVRPAAGRQVAADEEVDARRDEGLPRGGRRGDVGEVRRARPAADRDLDAKIRVRRLELPQLVEVAEQVLIRIRGIVGDAVDAVGPAPRRRLEVGPRIARDARAARRDECERVTEHVQPGRGNLLDRVAARVARPVGEERAAHALRPLRRRPRRGGGGKRERDDERSGSDPSPHHWLPS